MVTRREGLSQVSGAVQLAGMPREREVTGEPGREREDRGDVQEQTTFLTNWFLPLCF